MTALDAIVASLAGPLHRDVAIGAARLLGWVPQRDDGGAHRGRASLLDETDGVRKRSLPGKVRLLRLPGARPSPVSLVHAPVALPAVAGPGNAYAVPESREIGDGMPS